MQRIRITLGGWMLVVFLLGVSVNCAPLEEGGVRAQSLAPGGAPRVTLRADSGTTIAFATHNGRATNGIPPQAMTMPHLVLYRNGALTEPNERTLIVEVSGIQVPPSGVTVALQVETMHGNPDPENDSRFTVWRASHEIENNADITQTNVTAVFVHTFDAVADSPTGPIATPTDYFRYQVAVTDATHPVTRPIFGLSQDFALLMENQWLATLPPVSETSQGAAPDELMVYYCDMFPFRRDIDDPATWLRREYVTNYIGTEVLPQMVEAFRVQTDEWGFPWHDAWTSWRPGEDAERLSVALGDGATWFHGHATPGGFAAISISVKGNSKRYATLTDGLMSAFHHELFHNLQRNISQARGGEGNVDGIEGAWQFFSEGTAVLASSVGQPQVQFDQTRRPRAYVANANDFLGGGWSPGNLNTSYTKMFPNRVAMYWRFLYERCGGTENPAAGMDIIKRALTALYAGDVVDIASSTDLIEHVPAILDQTLAGASCPFASYEESLIAFARAIHALRLDGGRCTGPGSPLGCGFYDPLQLYNDPPVNAVTYSGETITYSTQDQPQPAGVPSSYGTDFVDILLDPVTDGQPLSLEFHGAPGANAEFVVQVYKLMDPGGHGRPRPVPPQATAPEVLAQVNADGVLSHVIPVIDTHAYNRLGLIITRVDAMESSDPIGEYTISVTQQSAP